MTVREALTVGTAKLAKAGVDGPALDAALLLARAMGLSRAALYAAGPDPVPEHPASVFDSLIARRAEGICVAYLVGEKEFRDLSFLVSPAVLVPRPDTETLVEAALGWIDQRGAASPQAVVRVLDACTGSGCIAISLKHERGRIAANACDISPEALVIAEENAVRLLKGGTGPDGVTFFRSDLMDSVPGMFDLIVSNPPYIPAGQIPALPREVRAEPSLALDGGRDGLVIIRRLILQATERLSSGGRLLIEAGWDQGAEISRLLSDSGFDTIETYRDLGGRERVTGGTRP